MDSTGKRDDARRVARLFDSMTAMKAQQTEEIEVQKDIFVHCPKESFVLKRAVSCKGCDCFRGIMKVSEDEDQTKALRIFCGHPVTRSLVKVDIG